MAHTEDYGWFNPKDLWKPEPWHFEYFNSRLAPVVEPCYSGGMTNHTDTLTAILNVLDQSIDLADAAPTVHSKGLAFAGAVDIVRSIVNEALDAEDEEGATDLPESDAPDFEFEFNLDDILGIDVESLLSKLPGVGGLIFGGAPGAGPGFADLLQNLPDNEQIKDSLSGVFTAGDVPAGFQDILNDFLNKPKQ
ncbi:hypothetical protein SEA_ZOOMAN_174 [Microbacterium phage Zooman]|nr:hypothetical protein SEA_ZOOMAN_174 [Microbacterium phage Zooman]